MAFVGSGGVISGVDPDLPVVTGWFAASRLPGGDEHAGPLSALR
jgi:hypothetical protein